MAIDLADKPYSVGQIQKSVWDEETNRLRVDAEVTAVIGELAVDLNQSDDSVAIGDGTNLVHVNPDGALDVNIKGADVLFDYNSITVLASATATILTKTFSNINKVKSILLSGDNLGKYTIYLNGDEISVLRTTWLNFNLIVPFNDLKVNSGDILEVTIVNNNTSTASFNATLFFQDMI